MPIRGHGGEYQVDSLSLPITQPSFPVEATTNIVGIKQSISATNQFTGVAPTTTPVFSGNMYTYPVDAQGGLFDPGNTENTVRLVGIELDLADQTSWTLDFVDVDSNAFSLYSGTTEASFFVTDPDIVNLLPGETLQLTTVGASLAMNATLKFRNGRSVR